jgi:hypothetical protein
MTGPPEENRVVRRRTYKEIIELNKTTDWGDRSPLTDQELAALLEKLNSPTHKGGMSRRERIDRHRLGPIIRPREIVDELLAEVELDRTNIKYAPSTQRFGAGVVAGLRWATGREAQSPITGKTTAAMPPTYREVYGECADATRISEGRAVDVTGMGRDYATGVEIALMWLMGDTAERPWGRRR